MGSVNSIMHVVGIESPHGDEQHRRQSQQHDARQATFAGQGLDLSPNLESFANEVADLVENFRQVTTRLPLQDDRRGEEPQVEVRHAFGHFVDGFFQRLAEVLRFVSSG